MGLLYSTEPSISYLTAIIAGYRRIVAVRTDAIYDRTWEFITHLKTADGLVLTKETVVDDIDQRRYQYFTYEDGDVAFLIVERQGFFGRPYVRSKPDCSYKNNLLNLTRF